MLEFKNGILVKCPLPFVIDLIPIDNKTSRSQLGLIPDSITVHNFGDDKKPTAEQVGNYIDKAYDRYASWHFTVGYYKGILTVIQELPIDEVAWGAGDGKSGPGNRTSLHIECEENKESENFMIKFIILLMKSLNINVVVPHKHWSGKYCPRMILPNWKEFIKKVKGEEIMTKKDIQRGLKTLGFYDGPIDGDIGPNSKFAVKAFQMSEGLIADGSPGPATQSAIQKSLDEMDAPSHTIEQEIDILKQKVAAIEKKL